MTIMNRKDRRLLIKTIYRNAFAPQIQTARGRQRLTQHKTETKARPLIQGIAAAIKIPLLEGKT